MNSGDRPEPPAVAGEAETLIGFIDFLRATMEWRTSGLSDDKLNRPLAGHPSPMTLGGMLKHLAFVESYWFEHVALGEEPSEPWLSADWDADPDWDWHSAVDDTGEQIRTLWLAQVERSRAILTRLLGQSGLGLDGTHALPGSEEKFSLRWILTHMVEEYARHCGHADLIREAIDGQVGE